MGSIRGRHGRAVRAVATAGAVLVTVAMIGPLACQASAASSAVSALSAAPKEVVIDSTTGLVQSVTPLSQSDYEALLAAAAQASGATSAGLNPDVNNHNICTGGDACYYTSHVPYADQGFWGSAGTFHGSWPYRNAFDTGSYDAEACWNSSCTGEWGPNTYISLSPTVTGTSVTIY